jgi:hypothetical protein
MEIDFAELFADGGTCLEIYLCTDVSDPTLSNDIRVGHDNPFAKMNAANTTSMQEYYYRDLVFSYDKSNDSQRVLRRTLVRDVRAGNLYLAVFREEPMPAYVFPCTTDIPYILKIQRKTVRLGNRLHIIQDTENNKHNYLYVRYNHSDNVDISKMKSDINSALCRISGFTQ